MQDQPADLVLVWEPGSPTNYVTDGSFEKGAAQWGVLLPWRLASSPTNAQEGTRYAEIPIRNNNLPRLSEALLFQQIKLPTKGLGARLLWWDYVTGLGEPDLRPRFKVDVHVVGSQTFDVLYEVTCGEGNFEPWNRHELDLSAYLGTTFMLTFSVTNQFATAKTCAARVDDVRVEMIPTTVEYEVYLGPTVNLGPAQLLGNVFDSSWSLTGLAAGSTNYWKVIQITDGVRTTSPVFQFTVGGSAPAEAPLLSVDGSGEELQLHALTNPGGFYQFEQTDTPDSATWQPLGDEIIGDGSVARMEVAPDGAAQFFRIRVTR